MDFVHSCNYPKLVNKCPTLLFCFVKQKKCFFIVVLTFPLTFFPKVTEKEITETGKYDQVCFTIKHEQYHQTTETISTITVSLFVINLRNKVKSAKIIPLFFLSFVQLLEWVI